MFWKIYWIFILSISFVLSVLTPFLLINETNTSKIFAILFQEFLYLNLLYLSFRKLKPKLIEITPEFTQKFKKSKKSK